MIWDVWWCSLCLITISSLLRVQLNVIYCVSYLKGMQSFCPHYLSFTPANSVSVQTDIQAGCWTSGCLLLYLMTLSQSCLCQSMADKFGVIYVIIHVITSCPSTVHWSGHCLSITVRDLPFSFCVSQIIGYSVTVLADQTELMDQLISVSWVSPIVQ